MKKILTKAAAALLSAGAAVSFAMPASMSASADWKKVGYIGDLNEDGKFNVGDLVILTRFVLGSSGIPESGVYDMDGAYYLTGVRSQITSLTNDDIKSGVKHLQLADIDQDGVIDTYDLVALRKIVIEPDEKAELVYRWYEPEIEKPDYICDHSHNIVIGDIAVIFVFNVLIPIDRPVKYFFIVQYPTETADNSVPES